MSCFLCPHNNVTKDKNCLGCGAVRAGKFVKQPVTVTYADDKCQIPTLFCEPQIPREDGEGHRPKPSCMELGIEFYGIKCVVVLSKEDGEPPVRVSAIRKGASSNMRNRVKSSELQLPL